MRALPHRLDAAVPVGAGEGVWQQCQWRACAVPERAGEHAGAAGRRVVVRGGGGDFGGTGTAYGALQRMNLSGNETIAIFGQGPVGLSATQLAEAMGARVIALDISPERLARAAVRCRRESIRGRTIRWAPPGNSPRDAGPMPLDTSSPPQGGTRRSVRAGVGHDACFVGEGGEVRLDVSADLLRRQVTVIRSWTFSTVGQAECARFIAERHRRGRAVHPAVEAGAGGGGVSAVQIRSRRGKRCSRCE